MKTFEIKVTQDLFGSYNGILEIEAETKEEALTKIKNMSKDEIDQQTDWTHSDEYEGMIDSIEIQEDTLNEIE
jgi:hypothetical protein